MSTRKPLSLKAISSVRHGVANSVVKFARRASRRSPSTATRAIAATRVGDTRHPRRFVALAAMRNRRQKRAVGLDQQAIERHARATSRSSRPSGKVTMPASDDVETRGRARAGHVGVAGEAVDHAAQPRRRLPRRSRKRVVVGFARVNDDRQVAATREPDCARNTACCTSRGEKS